MEAQFSSASQSIASFLDKQALLAQRVLEERSDQLLLDGADKSVAQDEWCETIHADVTGDHVKSLARALDRGTFHLVMLLPAFDRQRVWEADGYRSCASWMNAQCGMSPSAANDRCRVAYALETLPVICQLFRLGELSWSKVRALTRIATPENERQLAADALSMTASAIERMARQYRNTQTSSDIEDEDERAKRHYDRRYLLIRQDDNGMVRINASLPPLEGAAIVKSLARAEDEILQQIDVEQLEQPVSGTQRRADSLALMAMKHMAAESVDVRMADRYQVIIHVDAATLHQTKDQPGPDCRCHVDSTEPKSLRAYIEDGPAIAASTARRLVDDCSVLAVVEAEGEPLSIGRKTRKWPQAISRAIHIRDKCCQFPGCDSTRHLQLHHIQHWVDGGETSIENGVSMCGFHHRLIHERKYKVERTERDANGRLPKGLVNVEMADGDRITEIMLTSTARPFRVRRVDGSLVQ
ncbi:MAG: DUF222 domain-containing protein [Granulosicoccus sp.]